MYAIIKKSKKLKKKIHFYDLKLCKTIILKYFVCFQNNAKNKSPYILLYLLAKTFNLR